MVELFEKVCEGQCLGIWESGGSHQVKSLRRSVSQATEQQRRTRGITS